MNCYSCVRRKLRFVVKLLHQEDVSLCFPSIHCVTPLLWAMLYRRHESFKLHNNIDSNSALPRSTQSTCETDGRSMSFGRLEWPDCVVLAAFLAISLGIGVYHSLTGGRQRTTEEFIMANRRLGIIPTTLSLFVSFQSAVMMLGFTAEMYVHGVQFMIWAPAGYVLSTLLVERLVIPWIFPLQLVSVNDVSFFRGFILSKCC